MIVWFSKAAIAQPESPTTALQRVQNINSIIDTLIDAQLAFTRDPNKKEYRFEDGQTKISVVYEDLNAIANAILVWERTKQIYVNRYNGRMNRLVDSKSFPNWNVNINP